MLFICNQQNNQYSYIKLEPNQQFFISSTILHICFSIFISIILFLVGLSVKYFTHANYQLLIYGTIGLSVLFIGFFAFILLFLMQNRFQQYNNNNNVFVHLEPLNDQIKYYIQDFKQQKIQLSQDIKANNTQLYTTIQPYLDSWFILDTQDNINHAMQDLFGNNVLNNTYHEGEILKSYIMTVQDTQNVIQNLPPISLNNDLNLSAININNDSNFSNLSSYAVTQLVDTFKANYRLIQQYQDLWLNILTAFQNSQDLIDYNVRIFNTALSLQEAFSSILAFDPKDTDLYKQLTQQLGYLLNNLDFLTPLIKSLENNQEGYIIPEIIDLDNNFRYSANDNIMKDMNINMDIFTIHNNTKLIDFLDRFTYQNTNISDILAIPNRSLYIKTPNNIVSAILLIKDKQFYFCNFINNNLVSIFNIHKQLLFIIGSYINNVFYNINDHSPKLANCTQPYLCIWNIYNNVLLLFCKTFCINNKTASLSKEYYCEQSGLDYLSAKLSQAITKLVDNNSVNTHLTLSNERSTNFVISEAIYTPHTMDQNNQINPALIYLRYGQSNNSKIYFTSDNNLVFSLYFSLNNIDYKYEVYPNLLFNDQKNEKLCAIYCYISNIIIFKINIIFLSEDNFAFEVNDGTQTLFL